MARILAVAPVLPEHRYAQAELTQAFLDLCLDADDGRAALVRRLHASSTVEHRHLAFPLAAYPGFDTFSAANDAFLEAAVDLGAQALGKALADAGLHAQDLDVLLSTTVTGVAVPSLDARIAERLGCRTDLRRTALFGQGCAGGAAGIARLHDQLLARPGAVGALVSVELCSLTTQRGDGAVPHLVASALFGDGAAAVVAVGDAHDRAAGSGPRVVDSASALYPGTDRAMGWDVGEWGLRIVLDAQVPELVAEHLGPDVRAFLSAHGLSTEAIDPWICHPGGPKVLTAAEATLGLDAGELAVTWESLRRIGNLSSASVLHVLADTWATNPPTGDRTALLLAMGPGFASELVLLEW